MSKGEEGVIQRILSQRLATKEQVDEAVAICQQMEAMGLRSRSVAEVLCEKGYLESEDLEALRREQHTFEGREQIAGYRLLELLGRGATGPVFKAKQLSLDRVVAMKLLDPSLAADQGYAARFMEEARSVARLSHTNLISGIDVGEDEGVKYLVMEFADGISVARLLRRGGALDEERALLIALQVARALAYAHKNGLVHGGVKPEDVIVTRDGVAKLADLGVARRRGAEAEREEPDYVSPEQARGLTEIGPASDQYALGAVLFHMVTGRVPFEGASREAILGKHLTEPVPSASALVPDLSARTETVLKRCLGKGPSDRYLNTDQLVDALETALRELRATRGTAAAGPAAGSGPSAASATAPAPRRRRRRR